MARLDPPLGRLRTISPDKFAAVYVTGKFMGRVGEFNNPVQGLELNPGEYTVRIDPVGGAEGKKEHIRIETDQVTIVRTAKQAPVTNMSDDSSNPWAPAAGETGRTVLVAAGADRVSLGLRQA